MLDPEEVEKSWTKIKDEAEAIRPVITVTGLVGWVEPESERIMRGLFKDGRLVVATFRTNAGR
jgi:hypothetical protein